MIISAKFSTRNYFDIYASTLEREELSEVDDVFTDSQLHFTKAVLKKEDTDANSCYHSASASHTDNYYSTDEHENIFHTVALHSSDSGADISEKNFDKISYLKKEVVLENVPENKDIPGKLKLVPGFSHSHVISFYLSVGVRERNNSLPEIFTTEDLQESWEKFWSKNGENIIWASWIEKYSDYINPDYLGNSGNETDTTLIKDDEIDQTPCPATKDTSFTFAEPKRYDEGSNKPLTEIVISRCSPKPNLPIEDSYEVLSHKSSEDLWNFRSTENESLLSPRCDSVTSSVPFTIGTTDSMTNVTHMTVSSYDFGQDSSSSDSKITDSISSESSEESSEISALLETECLVGAASSSTIVDDNAMDNEQYWQILWQKHFQELYAHQYSAFMNENGGNDDQMSNSLKSDSIFGNVTPRTKSLRRRKMKTMCQENLPKLVSNLKIDKCADKQQVCIFC